MLLGEDRFYQCPFCHQIGFQSEILSGNTFDSEIWSDGKMFSPMLPDSIHVTKCFNCGHIYWLTDETELTPEESLNTTTNETVKEPNIQDYLKIIKDGNLQNSEQEFYLRLRLWWKYNDRVRRDKKLHRNHNDKRNWKKNLEMLFTLCDENHLDAKIMQAEILRNLGKFKKSRRLLHSIDAPDYQQIKKQMVRKCLLRKRNVFMIA